MTKTVDLDKEAIYQEVTRRVNESMPDQEPTYGLCFYSTIHGIEVLREHGVRAILQAGSCSWPRIPLAEDDGQILTHYGYIWSPTSIVTRVQVSRGLLPEMHAWIGLPADHEIVDFSTGRLPEHAASMGLDWPGEKPPKFLWGRPGDRIWYEPIEQAVIFMLRKVCEIWSVERARQLIA